MTTVPQDQGHNHFLSARPGDGKGGLLVPLTKTFLPSEVGYPDPQAPHRGLAFPVLQTCLLPACCMTLGQSLLLSGPPRPHQWSE